jgi:hypothetical protein
MLTFIGGFVTGGLVGFFLCALLHINRFAGQNSFIHAKSYDRRRQHKATFPLIDGDGVLVDADRRVQPDRRSYPMRHGI